MSAPKTLKLPPNLQSWLRACPGSNSIRCSTHGRWPQRRPCDQLLMDYTGSGCHSPQRIQYKLCVLVYGCLNGTAPGYLSDLTVSVGSTARRQLRSASMVAHQLKTVRSPLQVHERRTVYRQPQSSAQPPNRFLP